jgi:tungstate transport system substrate-binding protein
VAFTHDPDNELRFLDKGTFGDYRKVMYNDFVIAGPAADPGGVRSATSATEAMRKIAGIDVAFVSRGDSSGTNARELLLWKKAGGKPLGDKYLQTGQGMSATLRIASERKAYVLTDRATFAQLSQTLRLTILYEGDPLLLNSYAVSYRKGLTGPALANARAVFDWLADGKGRDQITGFTVQGQPAFHVWPTDRPRSQPGDLPNGR